MITYKKVDRKHQFSMSTQDLGDMAELIWLLKHTPPPIGYNRKPFTLGQQRIIEEMYRVIQFPSDFGEFINSKTGQ